MSEITYCTTYWDIKTKQISGKLHYNWTFHWILRVSNKIKHCYKMAQYLMSTIRTIVLYYLHQVLSNVIIKNNTNWDAKANGTLALIVSCVRLILQWRLKLRGRNICVNSSLFLSFVRLTCSVAYAILRRAYNPRRQQVSL